MKAIFGILMFMILVSCTANKNIITAATEPVFKTITEAMYSAKRKGELKRKTALNQEISNKYFYNKNGKIVKSHKFETDGTMYEEAFFTLNESGNVIKGIVKDNNGNLKKYWIIEFDTKGNKIALKTYNSDDELMDNERSLYDETGNKIENIWENKKYDFINTTKFKYNTRNQLIEKVHHNGAKDRTDKRTYEYNEKGNETKQVLIKSDGSVTTFISEYDEYNNMTIQKWYDENGKETHETSFTYIYDKYGNWITRKRSSNGELGLVWERKIEYQ